MGLLILRNGFLGLVLLLSIVVIFKVTSFVWGFSHFMCWGFMVIFCVRFVNYEKWVVLFCFLVSINGDFDHIACSILISCCVCSYAFLSCYLTSLAFCFRLYVFLELRVSFSTRVWSAIFHHSPYPDHNLYDRDTMVMMMMMMMTTYSKINCSSASYGILIFDSLIFFELVIN